METQLLFWRGVSRLVEEAEDLAGDVLATGLLVVHDTGRGGEDDIAEGTGGEQLLHPVLDLAELHVEAGRDDTALVDAAVELHDDLARSVVIHFLELSDVTCADATRVSMRATQQRQRGLGMWHAVYLRKRGGA